MSGGNDSTIRRWNAESGERMEEIIEGHESWVGCIALTYDEKMIYLEGKTGRYVVGMRKVGTV